jgi:hypothetical protein
MIGTVSRNAAGIGDLFEHAVYGAFGKHPVVRRQCTLGGVQDQNRALDPGVVIRRVDLLEVPAAAIGGEAVHAKNRPPLAIHRASCMSIPSPLALIISGLSIVPLLLRTENLL